jgi:hypothetical protein
MKSLDSAFFCKIAFTAMSKSISMYRFKFSKKSPKVVNANLDT